MFGPGGPIIVGQVPIIPQVPIIAQSVTSQMAMHQPTPDYMSEDRLQEKGMSFFLPSFI